MAHVNSIQFALGALLATLPVAWAADSYQPVDTQTSGQPLAPAEALARMRLPPGFKVTLAAAEPAVRQPIAMAYDARGRLWVAESYSYNGSDFTDERHDRIVIFEDADGDGVFESRRVFHDHLNRLTGLAVGLGGVWVTTPPTLSFIPDRNHDDVPDSEPEVKLDGWTLKAEHNSVNGLTWGPDGWLYGRHGIKEPSHPGLPGTPVAGRPEVSCSIWRYHPARRVFEVVADGTINPWGLDFDELGQMFLSTSVVDHLWHVVPGSSFKRWVGRDLAIQPHLYDLMDPANDHSHRAPDAKTKRVAATDDTSGYAGGHSHSDAMIYLGDRWPATYRGTVLMSNIHGRRINRDRLQRAPEDGRLIATHEPDFLRANDPWFRAVSLQYGPDGDVVMSDWSDNGECHDRDGVHRNSGRLYKISWGDPRQVAVNLQRAKSEELVALQLHPNDWFVRQARLQLAERALAGENLTTVNSALRRIFESHPAPAGRLRALWALHVSGGTDGAWLAGQLADRDENVRYWAVRLLVDGGAPAAKHADLLVQRAGVETSWIGRMALASALPVLGANDRWKLGAALARTAQPGEDRNLTRLLWFGWHSAVAAHPADSLALAPNLRVPALVEWIGRRLAEQAAQDPGIVVQLLSAIGKGGTVTRDALVSGAAAGLELRSYDLPTDATVPLRSYFNHATTALRQPALTLAARLRDPVALERLRANLRNKRLPSAVRTDALATLAPLRPAWLAGDLLTLLAAGELIDPAIRALVAYDDPRIAPAVLAVFPRLNRTSRAAAVDTLLARDDTLRVLLDALAAGRIDKKDITHFQARQVAKSAAPELRRRFETLWGSVNSSSEALAERMKKLRMTMKADFLELADVPHGRALFEQRCAVCHTLFGKGGKLGPDLTGSGRKELEYLIVNITDPNAAIPADWRLTIATLTDGRVVAGSIGAETETTVTLLTMEGTVALERATIRTLERSNTSLMPTGLLDDLPPDHVRDLFAFLMSDDGAKPAGK